MYELLHESPNDLRRTIIGNQEISGSSQRWLQAEPSVHSFSEIITEKQKSKLFGLSIIAWFFYFVPLIFFLDCIFRNSFILDVCQSSEYAFQQQPSGGVLKNNCSENMQQIYRNLQSNFIEITLWHGWSPINLLDGCFWLLVLVPNSKKCG